MIPSIENIAEGVKSGEYTTAQAVTWLYQHAEAATQELRDAFAMAALQGECAAQDGRNFGIAVNDMDYLNAAMRAYKYADAMLKAREATND